MLRAVTIDDDQVQGWGRTKRAAQPPSRPSPLGHPERQPHHERAALTGGALHPDTAPVLLDELLGPGQPEARARDPVRDVARAVEAFEDAWQLLRRDADPLIVHAEHRQSPIRRLLPRHAEG